MLETSRTIDIKHGTSITRDDRKSVMDGRTNTRLVTVIDEPDAATAPPETRTRTGLARLGSPHAPRANIENPLVEIVDPGGLRSAALPFRPPPDKRTHSGSSSPPAEAASCPGSILSPSPPCPVLEPQNSQGLVVASPVLLSITDAETMTPVPDSTATRANPEPMSVRPANFWKTRVCCFHSPAARDSV